MTSAAGAADAGDSTRVGLSESVYPSRDFARLPRVAADAAAGQRRGRAGDAGRMRAAAAPGWRERLRWAGRAAAGRLGGVAVRVTADFQLGGVAGCGQLHSPGPAGAAVSAEPRCGPVTASRQRA